MTKRASTGQTKRDASGGLRIRRVPAVRRLTFDSFDAVGQGRNMIAMCEFDVTDVQRFLRARRRTGRRSSPFGFAIKAIALTLGEDKAFNAVLSGRRIIEFDDVDVSFPIEMERECARPPRQVTIRNASEKTIDQIVAEIDTAKTNKKATGAGPEDAGILKLAA